jgi:hypothetical protein
LANAGFSVFINSLISDFVSPEFYCPSLTATQPASLSTLDRRFIEHSIKSSFREHLLKLCPTTSDLCSGLTSVNRTVSKLRWRAHQRLLIVHRERISRQVWATRASTSAAVALADQLLGTVAL